MRWEAANVVSSNSHRTEDAISIRNSSETVEAALARLTKAYSTAMSCVGAMHKLQVAAEKEGPWEEFKTQSQSLASAARATFEKAILLDPLIAKFCPTWTRVIHESGTLVRERRPEPAILTSASHKATIGEIAYLSLLNYSDLLVASQQRSEFAGSGILDTGVVKPLPLVGWEVGFHQKLALVSLCDASDLDGSDPVLWLKLACAARRLSILSGGTSLRYRRLERHALEMGKTALPPSLPPNRSIVRALKEHYSLPDDFLDEVEEDCKRESKLILDIPRYSWSILGRMLIRASREGSNPDSREAFGSPRVELHLSPMLLLPHRPLGLVCKYLQNEDVWRFEATCRGLSASILSARAMMERTEAAQDTILDNLRDPPDTAEQSVTVPASRNSSGDNHRKKQFPERRQRDEPARARSSKRVLSQLITSGKRADRESKRRSVKYCFLASILNCTSEDEMYRKCSTNDINWDMLIKADEGTAQGLPKEFESPLAQPEGSLDCRLDDSSLKAFVDKWSSNNSGPFDILQRYISHVSLNVVDVFQSDQDSLALSGVIVDCVDLLTRKAGVLQNLDLCTYGHVPLNSKAEMECLDYLSVNLLNAELRLKRSDGQLTGLGDFDSDLNFVAVAVSELLAKVSEVELARGGYLDSRTWICLKTRLHWLAAGYYIDRSRLCQNVAESRIAGDFGIEQVEHTIHCLSLPAGSPVLSVKTPHLTSPRRSGAHWKVLSLSTLHSFRDEIQASSVVSAARQQFMEKLIEIEKHWQDVPGQAIRSEDVAGLLSVGTTLSRRYNGTFEEVGSKHEELLNDFVATYEGDLSLHLAPTFREGKEEKRWGALWFLAPSGAPHIEHIVHFPNLSILTILMSCLSANEDGRLAVTELVTRMAVSSFELLSKRGTCGRPGRNISADEFDDIMSDDGSTSDDEDDRETSGPRRCSRLSGKGRGDHGQDCLVAIAAELFVDKIVYMFENHLNDGERRQYLSSFYCLEMIGSAMTFISNWYEPRGSRRASSSTGAHDLRIFFSICSLQGAVARMNPSVLDVDVAFFLGCYKVLVCQRHVLPIVLGSGNDNRSGRSAKLKEFLGRAELIGAVLSEVAIVLSRHASWINGRDMGTQSLLRKAFGEEGLGPSAGPNSLARLVEALLYLWDVVVSDDASNAASVFGRICVEALLVPVAASIIGLCGSALGTFSGGSYSNDDFSTVNKLSLSEFLDSDGSANEYESENLDSHPGMRSEQTMKLLRHLCHAIHCISLVVDTIDEKNAWQYIPKTDCEREKGTFLPLTATRVLSFLADVLLTEFRAKSSAEESLWQESFPYGTRAIGTLLDSVLHKLYKQLYGFTIHGHWIEKEKVSDEKCKSLRCPETTNAAAQLYRCIQRAYTLSRKSVPKAALECVAMALPVEEVSPSRDAMRSFIFSKQMREVSCTAISLLAAGTDASWCEPFIEYHEVAKRLAGQACDDYKDEIRMVRKGIAKELAQAPLPNISQACADSTKGIRSDESQKTSEERAIAAFQERELSKKFWAILDNMSYGDPSDYVGWLRAAECVTLKAELIADRLGSSLGSARIGDFSIATDNRLRQKKLMSLAALEESQQRQYTRNTSYWIPFIGDDLAIYVDYQWASFSSLEQCASLLSDKYKEFNMQIRDKRIGNASLEYFETHACNEIESSYRNKDFISWQQAWGGMFVEALRTIALRCISMAFFLVGEGMGASGGKEMMSLQSEILETMGIAKYSELMGSQGFGYPMRALSDVKKREISETARICFKQAAAKVEGDNNKFTFDVLLMLGKCFEKTAKTYAAESFAEDKDETRAPPRVYERMMTEAFATYQKSLDEASALDEEGALPDVHAGGSSHGKAEVVYRLHASRLKCLIAAHRYPDSVRERAIAEAVRVSRCHWYDCDSTANSESSTNMMVWKILADIVAALAQCRLEHQFFHRSVYRHSQALMWAPAIHDPATGLVHGSLGVVPATKSHLLRGLNSSMACANSAEVIMSALFEKRRPQLVSVWVTNTSSSPSPLEIVNNSTRKFDSLRGKYFAAYVEVLTLCKRSSVLEALFQQLISTKRDLPAFYQASALVRGALPETSHAKDNLLGDARSPHTIGLVRDLKRITNKALASILVSEAPTSDSKNDYIKKCYTCFLRLNTSIDDLGNLKRMQYDSASLPEVEALCLAYLARPESNDFSIQSSDWAGGWKKAELLKRALAVCSELFPSLASTLYRKIKPKKTSACNTPDEKKEEEPKSRKRSAPESDTMQFVVAVPPGLNVGDKFQTTVRVGSQMKTLRLTVPVGLPPKLKFSLKVPCDDEVEPSNKGLKEM